MEEQVLVRDGVPDAGGCGEHRGHVHEKQDAEDGARPKQEPDEGLHGLGRVRAQPLLGRVERARAVVLAAAAAGVAAAVAASGLLLLFAAREAILFLQATGRQPAGRGGARGRRRRALSPWRASKDGTAARHVRVRSTDLEEEDEEAN